LHSRGYSSVYLPLPLAAGLATETFAAHVQQRIRWARGMAQILRLDCPLFKNGLTLSQRLNYFNAMLHFFFGLPVLILFLAPLSYLLLGVHPIQADALALLAYIVPHVGLSTLANSLLSDRFRHSFWAGVYEVSIAQYTTAVTLLALVNPKLGRFNVTDKGAQLDRARFDFAHSRGTLILLGLSALGLMVAFPLRLALFAAGRWEPTELHSILINAVWATANIWTLVAAACVAYEQPQQRQAPRVRRDFPCEVLYGEQLLSGRTLDLSESGVRVALATGDALPENCDVLITSDHGVAVRVRAELRWCDARGSAGAVAAYRFSGVDAAVQERLIRLIFSGDRSWLAPTHPRDDPFRSFGYLVSTFWRVTRPRRAQLSPFGLVR
jgi:cellulose synthase (UDP-forming)